MVELLAAIDLENYLFKLIEYETSIVNCIWLTQNNNLHYVDKEQSKLYWRRCLHLHVTIGANLICCACLNNF